jgi:ATP-binding cassette subfamily B protein
LIIRKGAQFYVVYTSDKKGVTVADPTKGVLRLQWKEFTEHLNLPVELHAYAIQTTPGFFRNGSSRRHTMFDYLEYIKPYRKYFIQIFFGLLLAAILQLLPPFLTQVLVDKGINFKDTTFINLILAGFIVIQLGKVTAQVVREWINFYIGSRINISLISY